MLLTSPTPLVFARSISTQHCALTCQVNKLGGAPATSQS